MKVEPACVFGSDSGPAYQYEREDYLIAISRFIYKRSIVTHQYVSNRKGTFFHTFVLSDGGIKSVKEINGKLKDFYTKSRRAQMSRTKIPKYIYDEFDSSIYPDLDSLIENVKSEFYI